MSNEPNLAILINIKMYSNMGEYSNVLTYWVHTQMCSYEQQTILCKTDYVGRWTRGPALKGCFLKVSPFINSCPAFSNMILSVAHVTAKTNLNLEIHPEVLSLQYFHINRLLDTCLSIHFQSLTFQAFGSMHHESFC